MKTIKKGFIRVGKFSNSKVTSTMKKMIKLNNLTWSDIHASFERVAGKNYEYDIYAINENFEKLFLEALCVDGRTLK